MRDNIVDFLSLFFLNLMGFLTVLITSFLSPFILMWDFIKYIFLNKKQLNSLPKFHKHKHNVDQLVF